MIKLGVNIDHIATVRQARGTSYPDPAAAAAAAEAGGADFITVHLREDRRHISDADLPRLRARIATWLNLEIAATGEMIAVALRAGPRSVCLVPERRAELTTEGGLDVAACFSSVARAVGACREAGLEVSLFIDPDERQIAAAARAGADCVELHTGGYAEIADPRAMAGAARPLAAAAAAARAAGLKVNAGHGLRLDNVAPIAAIDGLAELNIGHAIVARALFVGMQNAVAEMRAAIGGR